MLIKSSLTEIYSKAFFKRYHNHSFTDDWITFLLEILKVFGKTSEDLPELLEEFYIKNPENHPVKEIIEYLIPILIGSNSPLYMNIVSIEREIRDTPYETIIRSYLKVKPKMNILSSFSPEWVWRNSDEVSNFMSDDNELYKTIQKLSELSVYE